MNPFKFRVEAAIYRQITINILILTKKVMALISRLAHFINNPFNHYLI